MTSESRAKAANGPKNRAALRIPGRRACFSFDTALLTVIDCVHIW